MTSRKTALPVPNACCSTGILSWVHFGDLHMTTREEGNFGDFLLLVDEVNCAMAGSVNFAYLPGDNADHGSTEEYELVREGLDRLLLPWFAIVGDHDVHPRSHANFLQHMMPMAFYSFDVGPCRFFALDCLAADDPGTFDLSREQLEWLRGELVLARIAGRNCVFFLHCYPSELGESSLAVGQLMRNYRVLLVDMGHTHYNEIAHDGQTLYTATRSTGQIEEGPVGFSVTNIDHGIVSWRFKLLGEWPLVMITAPADERLRTHHGPYYPAHAKRMRVRVKAWSDQKLIGGFVTIAERTIPLDAVPRSGVWEADLGIGDLREGVYPLGVELTDEIGRKGRDIARVAVHSSDAGKLNLRAGRDADNAIGAWPEHGILGTQLGPNKNGRKW